MTQAATAELQKLRAYLQPKLHHVGQFLMKQGITMSGNMVYGLLCVRMLSKPDYAMFAVLFGFMTSVGLLLDIGISNTLAPLVGEQTGNLQLIADYVASLRRIVLRLYFVVAPAASVIFILIVQKQRWGVLVVSQMLVTLLFAAWFSRVGSAYAAVLILRRDRDRYYRTQIIGSLGSLSLLLVFWAFHGINVYVSVLLNVAQIVYVAVTFYRRAHVLLGTRGTPSRAQEKAIVRLALPNIPSTFFYAIQGQITLMLIMVFGHGVSSVANVGALTRLGQILVFLAQMNPILIEPFFAKLHASRLKRNYLFGLAAVTLFAAGFTSLAFLFPEAFLWVLGPKYSQLRVEVGLLVLSGCIQFIGAFVWVVNTSRRFVYWWNNLANIVLTLLAQALFVWKMDMSTVRNVLILNIISATVALLVAFCCAAYGFSRGGQKLEPQPA